MRKTEPQVPAAPLTRDLAAIGRGRVVVPPPANHGAAGEVLVASLQAELMRLGFSLDRAAFDAAAAAPRDWLVDYHRAVMPALAARVGADRDYQPFYKNFPRQVMAMSDLALFLNALRHYWSDGAWEPPQVVRERGMAFEDVELRPVRMTTDDALRDEAARLAGLPASLTPQDKSFLVWAIGHYGAAGIRWPAAVPFKETLCLLAAHGVDVPLTTATDVLRVAVYLSGGDVSLPAVPPPPPKRPPWWDEAKIPDASRPHYERYADEWRAGLVTARDRFRFRRFSRAERRRLLGMIERTTADPEDMQRHLGRWLRLGERLHPGEFAMRFPRAAAAFATIRNQHDAASRVRTFGARVDLAFAGSPGRGIEALAQRPGEFARRLDWLLRTFGDDLERAPVLSTFARLAAAPRGGPSGKVMVELYDHFRRRARSAAGEAPAEPRVVMLKGERPRMKSLPPAPPIDAMLAARARDAVAAAIAKRVAALPALGRVWIDPALAKVPVPFAMRSLNAAVRTYVRGTRVPFRADARVIRAFIHWFDERGDVDLDLSVGLYDDALKLVGTVSFTGLKAIGCCHSGDVRHRVGACAEYVDVPVDVALAHGARYATVHVYNYDGGPMHKVRDCVFGLMEREHAEANAIFAPETIANCHPLANESPGVVACAIDLRERELIWADVESPSGPMPTIEGTASTTAKVLAALIRGTRLSIGELLALHARARGTIVADRASADVAFAWEEFATDYARSAAFIAF